MKRYPGIRSFSAEDQHLFHGRKQEIRELFQLMILNDIVVLFGKSGTGKTSLLKAGVCPKLEDRNLHPVFIRLNNTEIAPEEQVYQQLLEGTYIPRDMPKGLSMWEYFKKFWYSDVGEVHTPVIVFDQFEELFTLYSQEERRNFIDQFADIVNGNAPKKLKHKDFDEGNKINWETPPNVKFVLSIRSDFLFLLDELSADIPAILRCRFQLKMLNSANATKAITFPARIEGNYESANFTYSEEALQDIIKVLGKEEGNQLSSETQSRTSEIDASQLQLLCQFIENKTIEEHQPANFVVTPSFYGGQKGIEQIINKFYNNVILKIPVDYQTKVEKLLGKGLIRNNRRIIMEESVIKEAYNLPLAILTTLEEERLLRKEARRGVFYYEISHDTLIEPILKRFQLVEAREEQERFEKERLEKEQELAALKEKATAEKALREKAEINEKRARHWTRLAAVIAIIALLTAAAGNYFYYDARKQKNIAQENLDELLLAQRKSTAQQILNFAENYDELGQSQYACQNYQIVLDSMRYYKADSLYLYAQKQLKNSCRDFNQTEMSYDFSLQTGNCQRYDSLMKQGDRAFFKENAYYKALRIYQAATVATNECGILSSLPDLRIQRLVAEIDNKKEAAEIAQRKAEEAMKGLETFASLNNIEFGKINDTYDFLMATGKNYFEKGEYNPAKEFFISSNRARATDEAQTWINISDKGINADHAYENLNLEEAEKLYLEVIDFQSGDNFYARLKLERMANAKEVLKLKLGGKETDKLENLLDKNIDTLRMSGEGLHILPGQIKDLNSLVWLDLSSNNLTTLYKNLTYFKELESLDLSSNQLSSIDPRIKKLDDLEILDLSSNQLKTLPEEIGGVKGLRKLDLSANQIQSLPANIGELKKLKEIKLASNKLTEMPNAFWEMKKLKKLDLSTNQFKFISSNIANLKRLEELSFSANQLDSLNPELWQIPKLKKLNLEDNLIDELFGNIQNASLLKELNLSNNKLKQLPEEISQLKRLEELDLSENLLDSLPKSIGQLKPLKKLKLSSNQLKSLPKSLWSLDQLEHLDLSDNPLSGLSEEINKLIKLEKLKVSNIRLDSLPKNIGKLEKLEELDLSTNKLSALPIQIKELKKLKELTLASNKFESFPAQIGELYNLKELDLSNNKKIKELPESFSNLVKLSKLNLSENSIKSIPLSIGKLKMLSRLELQNNKIEALPPSFGELKELKKLDLSGNKLKQFPLEICSLKKLETLDLSDNSFDKIPPEIAQLKELKRLNLGGNPNFNYTKREQLEEWLPYCKISF